MTLTLALLLIGGGYVAVTYVGALIYAGAVTADVFDKDRYGHPHTPAALSVLKHRALLPAAPYMLPVLLYAALQDPRDES